MPTDDVTPASSSVNQPEPEAPAIQPAPAAEEPPAPASPPESVAAADESVQHRLARQEAELAALQRRVASLEAALTAPHRTFHSQPTLPGEPMLAPPHRAPAPALSATLSAAAQPANPGSPTVILPAAGGLRRPSAGPPPLPPAARAQSSPSAPSPVPPVPALARASWMSVVPPMASPAPQPTAPTLLHPDVGTAPPPPFTPHAPAAAAQPEAPRVGWEEQLGTVWLPRIGGVLLLIGAALGSMLIQPRLGPLGRVVSAYALGAVIAAAGWWTLRRSAGVGRVLVSIALSVGYFTSFAAHFIPATRIFESAGVSFLLMTAFLGGLGWLAEKWRSESTAAYGFILGVVGSLVSAQASSTYALVAMGLLAVGACVLLLRHEWTRLTAVALAGTYLGTFLLTQWFPPSQSRGAILAHIGAISLYHLVFSAAFVRWSRPWIAREAAALQAAQTEAIPELPPESNYPFSSAYSKLNSLAWAALTGWLLWSTKTLWPQAHLFFAAMAVVEGARLALPAWRRGTLAAFHVVLCFALVTSAITSWLGGVVEATALAALSLAVVIASTRSRHLLVLRPLTGITAGLAFGVSHAWKPAAGVSAPLGMLPGFLLLLTALPWEQLSRSRGAGGRTDDGLGVALRALETFSATARAAFGAMVIIFICLNTFKTPQEQLAAQLALSALLVAGATMVPAIGWYFSALVSCIITSAALFLTADRLDAPQLLGSGLWALGVSLLWQEHTRRLQRESRALWQEFVNVVLGVAISFAAFRLLGFTGTWRGMNSAVTALVFGFASAVVARGAAWSVLTDLFAAPRDPDETLAAGRAETREHLGLLARPGAMIAYVLALSSWIFCVLTDASRNFTQTAIIAAASLAVWGLGRARARSEEHPWVSRREFLAPWIAAAFFCPALITAAFGNSNGPLLAVAAAWGLVLLGRLATSRPLALAGATAILSLVFYGAWHAMLHRTGRVVLLDATQPLPGFALSALLIAGGFLLPRLVAGLDDTRRPADDAATLHAAQIRLAQAVSHDASAWILLLGGTMLALFWLSRPGWISPTIVTVTWGALAMALLAFGFITGDRKPRITAVVTFALATGRIFLHDLAGATLATKVVAFLGVGLLLMAAGIGYAMYEKRQRRAAEAVAPSNTTPHAP